MDWTYGGTWCRLQYRAGYIPLNVDRCITPSNINIKFCLCIVLVVVQKLCKQLHAKIDVVDEERYDYEAKFVKNNKDVCLQLHTSIDIHLHIAQDTYPYTKNTKHDIASVRCTCRY